jgi:DUF1009 family protein
MARRLTLIAGSGALVPIVAAAVRRRGESLQVIDLVNRGDIASDRPLAIPLSRPTELISAVREFGTTHIVFAGAVRISDRDREGLANAFGVAGKMASSLGDIGFAGMILLQMRLMGVKVIGAHEVAPELLAPEGRIAGPDTDAATLAAARLALAAARAVGAIDLGQSVVFSGKRAIAAEDAGGTDELLQRVSALAASGLAGNGSTKLILAKALKPKQPKFADLPSIGATTVTRAAEAGVSVIAVEAGKTLLIGRAELEAEAGRRGITVIGLRHG